jgi:uncharacterized membrane protein YoaK (UPF0700 family)
MSIGANVERIVDRAAVHAKPSALAVRDSLLVGLAFSAGIYEAICFLSFGKVFTGFQTGNLVFLGLGLAGTRPPFGPLPWSVVASLAGFVLGAALGIWILKRFDGDKEVEDDAVFEVWPRRVSMTLGVAVVFQLAFLVVWMATSPSTAVTEILLGLNAFGLGLQMNAVRSMHVPGISTTAETATIISFVSGVATWSLKAPAARRLVATIVSMAVGAYVGDWMLSHIHTYAPLLPLLVMAVVITIAAVTLKQHKASRTQQASNVRSAA